MNNYFFTFGHDHIHRVDDVRLDRDSILCVIADNASKAREIAISKVGLKFTFQYEDHGFHVSYFPRGVVLTLTQEEAIT